MIEQDLLAYLVSDAPLITLLGGQKIYFQAVPPGTVLPWVIFYVSPGGTRRRITQKFTEPRITTVFQAHDSKSVRGRTIIERVLLRLENYRGDLGATEDVHITCGSVFSLGDFAGTYRHAFNAYIRSKEITTYPATG